MVEAMREIRFYWFFILLLISVLTLGSSPCFCETGGVYDKNCYDQSHEFSSRWANSRAHLTPRWTPNDSHIVFGHAGRIFVADSDGSDLKSLSGSFEPLHAYSKTTDIDFSPTISPDGAKVAFTTLRYAEGELYQHTYEIAAQKMDGSDRRRLTDNSWDDVSPAWSPDGSRIAFISYREGGPRLYTMAPDGSNQRSIGPPVAFLNHPPVWSPDGTRLAFLAVESEPAEIRYLDSYDGTTPVFGVHEGHIDRHVAYTVGADGSGLTRLEWTHERSSPRHRMGTRELSIPEEAVSLLSWSPDGRYLAFSAAFYGQSPTLYMTRWDGKELRPLLVPFTETAHRNELSEKFGISWNLHVPLEEAHVSPFSGILDLFWIPDGSGIRVLSMGDIYFPHPTDAYGGSFGAVHEIDVGSGSLRRLGSYDTFQFDLGSGPERDIYQADSAGDLIWSGSTYPYIKRTTEWAHHGDMLAVYGGDPEPLKCPVPHDNSSAVAVRAFTPDGGVLRIFTADGSGKRVLVRNVDGRIVDGQPISASCP